MIGARDNMRHRLGNIDISLLDVSDSYVILTLTICGFAGYDLKF